MNDGGSSISDVINAWFGGALTTLAGAVAGRLMYHVGEVRKLRRAFFGRELVWELPIAIGMALIGEGVSAYWEFSRPVTTGVVATLAYLGPRGAEALLMRWLDNGKDGQ